MSFDALSLIARKRDGGELASHELRELVGGYLDGVVADEQMSAFLMAGVIRGFTEDETVALTEILWRSGETVDLSALRGPTVDKHSTGGVGDTTTLVVAPLLAACGAQVTKLSGRGLGHTGGTLDKLESIPGFRVDLSPDELRTQVDEVGLAVAAATQDLVPADKRLYALRDVTATVPSPALIASSVMSKKLAGGADHLVLDVKAGDGAFMKSIDDAVALAELCVRIGEAHGRRAAALVTDMSQPLGDAVGNALDVAEAVAVLRGEKPGRLAEVALELAATGLELAGLAEGAPRKRAEEALSSGAALDRFRAMIEAQGGDVRIVDDPWAVLPRAPVVTDVVAKEQGVVSSIACQEVGEIAARLGAGRRRPGDDVDHGVGVQVTARVGDRLEKGQVIGRVHARSEAAAGDASSQLRDTFQVGDADGGPELIHRRITRS